MDTNKSVAITGIATLFLLSSATVSAQTFTVGTSISLVDPGFDNYNVSDAQGPASAGSLQSYSVDTIEGYDLGFEGPATASASANAAGDAAVSVEGMYACGSCDFELTANTNSLLTYTNDSASAVNFVYDFFIQGPRVEVVDYANVTAGSGLEVEAGAYVTMLIGGSIMDEFHTGLFLAGGDVSHIIDTYGSATANYFDTLDGFGYESDNFYGMFAGLLAPGETLTIETEMYASLFGPGWELGGMASIGDPNDLTIGPGSSGELIVSAVPVPAAVWLFGSGLLGLVGIARRKA